MKNNKSKPLVVIQCYEDRQQTLPLRKAEPAPAEFSATGHQQLKREVTNGHPQPQLTRETVNGHAPQKRDPTNGHISEALNGHVFQKREALNGQKLESNGEPHSNGHPQQIREATDSPPPPPPMPAANGQQNGEHKQLDISKSTPKALNTDLVNSLNQRNGSLARTPTPDYNNKTDLTAQFKMRSVKDDKAELDSLESYTLKNPARAPPRPPSNYFVKAPSGPATMKKHPRPVSVTIGEYAAGGNSRREPSRLGFLGGDRPDGPPPPDDQHISNRLQSELALTLSRSNLRKKTDALGYQIGPDSQITNSNEDSDWSIDKNFHARYGNNLLPLPPSVTIPKVSKLKH